jgi:hypothetical protein
MNKKIVLGLTMAMGISLSPYVVYAAEAMPPASDSSSSEAEDVVGKDAWLGAMAPLIPKTVCDEFEKSAKLKEKMKEMNMDYDKCVGAIPDMAKKCQDGLYNDIPDKISKEEAQTWGQKLGECIGKSFAEEYLVPKS